MKNTDNSTKGIQVALQNNPLRRESPHPWHLPYNSRCLIKGCHSPVYYDGNTYYSLCLLHLQELHLGPYFKPHNEKQNDYD